MGLGCMSGVRPGGRSDGIEGGAVGVNRGGVDDGVENGIVGASRVSHVSTVEDYIQ